MQFPDNNSSNDCATLNEYLDGEMPVLERSAFEAHAEECDDCRIEIELHREIENAAHEIVLPKDFSKVVAATAESQVAGLRKRKERKVTLAIIAALSIVLLTAVGANLGSLLSVFVFGIEKIGAVFLVAGTFILNLILGIMVIVKVAATQMHVSTLGLALVFGTCVAVFLACFFFSGRIARLRDVQR